MKEMLFQLKKLLSQKERLLVAIDGKAASGKTTLARALAEAVSGQIISADDFFLRPEQKTAERLREIGGNFDRERFRQEVLCPLKEGRDFSYRPFDCGRKQFGEDINIENKGLIIIEGSYCQHPAFGSPYDVTMFLTISHEEQKRRLEQRCPALLERFLSEWIPMEDAYHKAFSIEKKANFIINTET